MITKIYKRVKDKKGVKILQGRAWEEGQVPAP